MEDKQINLIPDQWYQIKNGELKNINDRIWYIKFQECDNGKVKSSCYYGDGTFSWGGSFGNIDDYSYIPIDISIVQQYLPEDHSDKKISSEQLIRIL